MAQAGFTPISLYFSSTAAAVPTSGNLANGELALNIADMKLYAKNSAGAVTLLASSGGATGTVSSVAATVPPFLSIAGSPITTSGTLAISLSGSALPTTSGGTGLTSFTANGVVYASSSSALATGSALTFDGTRLGVGVSPTQSIDANGTILARSNLIAYGALVLQRSSSSLELPVATYSNGSGSILSGGTKGDIVAFGNAGFDGVIFANGNAEQMRLTSTSLYTASGINVGFGTSSTTGYRLNVVAAFSSGIGGAYIEAGEFNQSALIVNHTNASVAVPLFQVQKSGTGVLTLDSAGNVGVGTASPAFRLDVQGPSQNNGDAVRNMVVLSTTSAGSGYGGGIGFGGYYNGTSSSINDFASIQGFKENSTAGDYAGALRFTTRANGGSPTERLRIASNGAWGLAGANYGTSGQVLTSGGSGAAPTWAAAGGGGAGAFVAFGSTGGL